MIRAFIAVSIPEEILGQMEQVAARLRELQLDARFTKTSSIHLTLKFLGNVEEALVDDIGEALERSTKAGRPFSLTVGRAGVFPNFRRPRIVWVGIEAEPLMTDLQRKVDENLRSLGFELDKRAFKPHLTLARLKSSRNVSELRRFMEAEGEDLRLGSFHVDKIHLYQSILHPEGAEYRRLATCPLPTLG